MCNPVLSSLSEPRLSASEACGARFSVSGKGCPPWDRLAVQLPPVSGMWSGIGDGFDGIVGDQ